MTKLDWEKVNRQERFGSKSSQRPKPERQSSLNGGWHFFKAKWSGTCALCSKPFSKGDSILWRARVATKETIHFECRKKRK